MAKPKSKFKPTTPKMREVGFIRLRTGLWEHIASGKMTPHDFAVYLTLHKWANWHTGICITTAASIASNWPDWGSAAASDDDTEEKTKNRKRRTVQNCLLRLRKRRYIDYRDGDGKRGSYAILINKYEPSLGALVGWSLDVEATTDHDNPVYRYVSPTPFWEAYGEEAYAQHTTPCAEHVRSTVQSVSAALYGMCAVDGTVDCIVRVCFLDILELTRKTQEVTRRSISSKSSISIGNEEEDQEIEDESDSGIQFDFTGDDEEEL